MLNAVGLKRTVAILLTAFALAVHPAASLAATTHFEIPAGPLAAALKAFAVQSHMQLLYRSEALAGAIANAVSGDLDSHAALSALLNNTGLEALYSSETAATIRPSPGGARAQIDIPAGNLSAALKSLQTQAHIRIRYTKALVQGKKSPALSGRYAPAEALQALLAESGLEAAPTNATTFTLKATGASTTPRTGKADVGVTTEKVLIEGQREHVFEPGGNVDIERTVNDAQPYTIFDSQTIERSGATNIEDFLKQRLTMNAVTQTNGQQSNPAGYGNSIGSSNVSSINLRGLGIDHTLILVNGRRMANVSLLGNDYQPDVNGIPLSAIDRIEVLPSSASGIYGGSAIGGVVNIILKRRYSGGEIRANYQSEWDTNAPTRQLSATWGSTLENGKTQVMLSGDWSKSTPLLFGDRRALYDGGAAKLVRNAGQTALGFPPLGTTPNIVSLDTNPDGSPANLTLRDGTPLTSPFTSVPAGTTTSTSAAELNAGLLSHAGSYNLNPPPTAQSPIGLLLPLGVTPETRSAMFSLNRQMSLDIDAFIDGSIGSNESSIADGSNLSGAYYLPAGAPANPFKQAIFVTFPSTFIGHYRTRSSTQSVSSGLIAHLPHSWTAEMDIAWSRNRFSTSQLKVDDEAIRNDITNGAINIFIDTLKSPLNVDQYVYTNVNSGSSSLTDFALRGSGPLWALPWGAPSLTVGIEHRIGRTPASIADTHATNLPFFVQTIFLPRESVTDSLYLETSIPLVTPDRWPLVHSLEAQLSGRAERFAVDSGTPCYYRIYLYGVYDPSGDNYCAPTLNGKPISSKARYTSTNATFGLKYQPVPTFIVRASYGTAFLPPNPTQLLDSVQPDPYPSSIIDPRTGNSYDVSTISGGNHALVPQSSKSWNAGIVWEPVVSGLTGLRLSHEWYQIQQFNSIGNLSAQQILAAESTFPGRVTRDSTGRILLVNTSALNLFEDNTEGWDLKVDATRTTKLGDCRLAVGLTHILREQRQLTFQSPLLDYAGFVIDGGPATWKGYASLLWDRSGWSAGWTMRYSGPYKQSGSAGSPASVQSGGQACNGIACDNTLLIRQGAERIPSQLYHDLIVSYRTSAPPASSGALSRLTSGLTVQGSILNVFNRIPPYDAAYEPFYVSPFGDWRLRVFAVSIRKAL